MFIRPFIIIFVKIFKIGNMEFIVFLWNSLMRSLTFIVWLILELTLVVIITKVVEELGYPGVSNIIWIAFFVFISIQIVLKITRGLIKPLMNYIKSLF